MFADPKKVGLRRIKRRLKAGASIVVALAAGVFLACKGGGGPAGRAPQGPDARGGRDTSAGDTSVGARPDAAVDRASASGPAAGTGTANTTGGPPAVDAGTAPAAIDAGLVVRDAGLAVRDASADAARRGPHVDRHEHRTGMPVPDNLIE